MGKPKSGGWDVFWKPNGIPSHDTFGRVFSLIEAEAFTQCFMRWVEGVFRVTDGQVIAIDGKRARRSHRTTIGQDAIHLVSAWASANCVSLGQLKVADKSNEISAIPALLKLLDVQGCIVTIDAIGTQKEIATTIIERHADYILALKGNQGHLLDDVQAWFVYAQQRNWQDVPHADAESLNKVSGRVEIRRLWAIEDPLAFDYIRHYEGWTALRSLIMLQHERRLDAQSSTECAFYISSLPADASRLLQAIRDHWSLDVIFGEDATKNVSGLLWTTISSYISCLSLDAITLHGTPCGIVLDQLSCILDNGSFVHTDHAVYAHRAAPFPANGERLEVRSRIRYDTRTSHSTPIPMVRMVIGTPAFR